MSTKEEDPQEEQQRLKTLLQGAFSGPPTPLKDIPTHFGKKRAIRKDQPLRKRRQRKNRAA
jgi:hypothetical protein